MFLLFGILYLVFSVITIITAGTGAKIRNIAKPLTMPLLGVFYYLGAARLGILLSPLVLGALGFSTLGDLFLLRQNRKRFFLAGLFSFLIGHLAYFVYFTGSIRDFSLVPSWIWFTLVFYIIGALFILKLVAGRSRVMKVPVLLYVIIICGMNFSTLARCGNYMGAGFILPFSGSLLYMISDALLGVRNFKKRIPQISRVISVTYHIAQFLLIYGILRSYAFV
ncbi:MAG: lysoplasmalogenase [Spirochaetales bacterium]|nr:lysoplasmalogenase [Spirochaetales bacterium]